MALIPSFDPSDTSPLRVWEGVGIQNAISSLYALLLSPGGWLDLVLFVCLPIQFIFMHCLITRTWPSLRRQPSCVLVGLFLPSPTSTFPFVLRLLATLLVYEVGPWRHPFEDTIALCIYQLLVAVPPIVWNIPVARPFERSSLTAPHYLKCRNINNFHHNLQQVSATTRPTITSATASGKDVDVCTATVIVRLAARECR